MIIDFYENGMNAYAQRAFDKAFEWFDKGYTEKQDPRCAFALATMYYNGEGIERSFKDSTHYFCVAAEAGILPAQVSAGFAYANALGVPENFDKAAYYLKMAADKGEPAAKVTLAEIYAKGFGGGNRKEAARMIREVLSTVGGEEAYDVYTRYDLGNVS